MGRRGELNTKEFSRAAWLNDGWEWPGQDGRMWGQNLREGGVADCYRQKNSRVKTNSSCPYSI